MTIDGAWLGVDGDRRSSNSRSSIATIRSTATRLNAQGPKITP